MANLSSNPYVWTFDGANTGLYLNDQPISGVVRLSIDNDGRFHLSNDHTNPLSRGDHTHTLPDFSWNASADASGSLTAATMKVLFDQANASIGQPAMVLGSGATFTPRPGDVKVIEAPQIP